MILRHTKTIENKRENAHDDTDDVDNNKTNNTPKKERRSLSAATIEKGSKYNRISFRAAQKKIIYI